MTIIVQTIECVVCSQSSLIEVSDSEWERWVSGESLRTIFPHKTVAEYELMNSGIHQNCWINHLSVSIPAVFVYNE